MPSKADKQLEILTRDAAEVLPLDELKSKLSSGRPLRVKLGLDPGADHVTLGWTVVLRKLRAFQDLGHTAVLIVGDYTARIGDPSEREDSRPMLAKEEVDVHAEHVLKQFSLVLSDENLEIRRNSEWLDNLGTSGLLELATHYTLARVLERDDFAKRFAAEQPISLRELMYPLLQGYDSVAVNADVELGGTDQHFNLVVGRHIQRSYGQEPQVVMTMPLIEGTDGVKKMSQSVGNYVGITEPPDEIFGKLMRLPDELMGKYFRLTTGVSPDEIDLIEAQLKSGELRPEVAKRRLAQEVVALYHGVDASEAARAHFDRVFKERELPEEVQEISLPEDCVTDGKVDVPRLLKRIGLSSSLSEARRTQAQRGVTIDKETVMDEEVDVERLRGHVIGVGKRNLRRLV